MRQILIIEAEEEKKDNEEKNDDNIKSLSQSAIIRLQKKIADLQVALDNTKNSKLDDIKKKNALLSIQSQIDSIKKDIEGKKRTLDTIKKSDELKKNKEKKEAIEKEFSRYEDEYKELVEYCIKTDYGRYLYEGRLGDLLKSKLGFIKQIAIQMKGKLSDVLRVFLNKNIFLFFSKIGWELKKLFELAKKGYEIYSKITTFIPDLIAKKFFESNAGKWVKAKTQIVEDWMNEHPWLKTVSKLLLVALLVFAFLYGGSSGNPIDDFDMSDFILAFTGAITLITFITTERGFQFLYFMALGALGLNFPYALKLPINCALMLITTAAKYLKIYIRRKQDKADEMDKEAGLILARA